MVNIFYNPADLVGRPPHDFEQLLKIRCAFNGAVWRAENVVFAH